ncbi:MAG: YhfC family intramembrane metalloprotease [Ruminococcus sp.]|nr:YhfC family intramembrane metalloprotease [Ruminococcus sp.]
MYGEITFSADALWGYVYEVLFSVCFPILLFIILRRRHVCRVRVLLTGFVTYFLVSLVRQGFRVLLLTDSVRQLPALFYTVSALLSGVLEELGRYLAFRYALDGFSDGRDAVAYGIGHGGMEQMFGNGLQSFSFLWWGMDCNSKGFAAMTAGMEPERISAFYDKLTAAADNSFLWSLLTSIAWAESMANHIALSVLVLMAVHYRGQRNLLFAAMAIHTFMDILPPLLVWTGIPLPFAADLIIMLIPIIFTVKMWKKYGGGA